MSINISFMHYMKWTRLMLPVLFKEFELVCIFYYFCYSLSVSISKRLDFSQSFGPVSEAFFSFIDKMKIYVHITSGY